MAEFTPTPESEEISPLNPTADEVLESTEPKEEELSPSGASPAPNNKRKSPSISGGEEDEVDEHDDGGAGGLFGSGSEDEEDEGSPKSKKRRLSDEELDSGDDEGRLDRMNEDGEGEGEYEEKTLSLTSITLGRHAIPKGSDGELYHLKYPPAIGMEPKAFTLRSFQPPTIGHRSTEMNEHFSAYQTANSTIRWRRDPKDHKKLQSNSRIIRWSDGSLTLQIGSNPTKQHELAGNTFAPPQLNPAKPTPTSISGAKASSMTYNAREDGHVYLASSHQSISFAQLTNHLTTSLHVMTTDLENDDAVVKLRERLLANKGDAGTGPGVISITEDPELAKRKAELAEKEKLRAEKRRQNQAERERDRASRVFGAHRSAKVGGPAGLTVGGLEAEDGMGGGPPGRAKGQRKPRRRNSEYSEDEEDYRRGRTREDEYDQDDGFLVGSDEEPEVVEDESEEEEEFGEQESRGKSIDKGPEKDEAAGGARSKRRRVVDDEDDDE